MAYLIAISLGIGLAAAVGFRVFLPLLVLSIGVKLGLVGAASGFAWVGSDEALVTLAVASVVEVLAFYVPWVDHALDVIATPVAIGAGVFAMGAVVPGGVGGANAEWAKWVLAVVAGGGTAGVVQGSTVMVRGLSGVTTLGLANWVVSTVEWVMALVLAVLAVVVPVMAGVVLLVLGVVVVRMVIRRRRGRLAAVGEGVAVG